MNSQTKHDELISLSSQQHHQDQQQEGGGGGMRTTTSSSSMMNGNFRDHYVTLSETSKLILLGSLILFGLISLLLIIGGKAEQVSFLSISTFFYDSIFLRGFSLLIWYIGCDSDINFRPTYPYYVLLILEAF